MKIFQILNLFSLFKIFYSYFTGSIGQQYQLQVNIIDTNVQLIRDEGILFGIWSKYNPLGITQQVGLVGLWDSNCFHYQSLIGKSSRSLGQIYYDCLNPESKTIQKFVAFATLDGQQHLYQIDINPSEYENVWYLFELLYYPSANIIEFIIVKENSILFQKKLDSQFFLENQIKQIIGGSLIVQNSNINSIEAGTQFSYFPGDMQLITDPRVYKDKLKGGIESFVQNFDSVSEVSCNETTTTQISDQDLIWLDQKYFISENINIDSFILAGWFRITQVHQVVDEFTYHFLKISKNTRFEQFSNPNLSPFQLFYKISPNNNKIIITTYSYNYPSVSLDFTNSDNSFMITDEFQINQKISLWHRVFINLNSNQIFIQIQFFDSYDVYEYSKSHTVQQFRNVLFQVHYGNLMKSFQNYLDIQTRNNIFYNCQQYVQPQNCHFSCYDCDGPTNNDCLSCSEASHRIYIPEHKACICPYSYLDDQINQNCLSFSDQSFNIKDLQKTEDCQFGYFEFHDSCYPCPSIISDKLITCIECINNIKGWKDNPECSHNIYMDLKGSTAQIYYGSIHNFMFGGEEPYLQQNWSWNYTFFNYDIIFKIFSQLQESFNQFCQKDYSEFNNEFYPCYICNLDYCDVCFIEMTGVKCSVCRKTIQLKDGLCISSASQFPNNKDCRTPYYLTSLRNCKLCPINNCIYCFEYEKKNLEQSTLYANFEKFEQDEYLSIGCAMCEENYIFDFTIGQCIHQEPSLSNCLRSFINLQNQEICTLSSTDFSVASEIINCGRLIENCLQCILTPFYEIKCIICNLGFTASIRNGNCYKTTLGYTKIAIEGENFFDASIQRIQSFMMKFLPNQYFYQKSFSVIFLFPIPIACNEGYSFNSQKYCVKYCTSECLDCQDEERGSCTKCPELCEVCIVRSDDEIQKLNPYFKVTDVNRMYSNKCMKPISNKNVVIDFYFQIAKYCYNQSCNLEYIITQSIYQENLDDKIDIHYCNQIGVKVLKIQNNPTNLVNFSSSTENISQQTKLKEQIFSLQILKSEFNLVYNYIGSGVFTGFDEIEINNAYLRIIDDYAFIQPYIFQFQNQNQKVKFILNNIIIEKNQFDNTNSIFESELFGDITLNNISIVNCNFSESSLLKINFQLQLGKIKISKMTLQNCNITNSQLFSLINCQVQIYIEQLVIDQSLLINSSFITFFTNFQDESKLEIKGITITSSQFFNSQIFNCINLPDININNLILNKNSIILSKIIVFNKNFTLFQTQINNNNFIETYFITTPVTDNKIKIYCLVNNYKVSQNEFTNSSLFYISNENMYYQLTTVQIQINQGQDTYYQGISLFNINCFQIEIDNIQIVDSNSLLIFKFLEVYQIFASNIVYENLNIKNKVPLNLNCMEYKNYNYQLFVISGYHRVTFKNIKAIKLFLIDLQLIEISSTRKRWTYMPSSIELINLEFFTNLLFHQNQANYFSLMSINSEYNTNISIENNFFQKNVIHQQLDDLQDSAAVLIQVSLNKGYITINNLYCSHNALTNSSNSYMSLKSEFVIITNYTVLKHNSLPFEFWELYYDLQLENDQLKFDQEQINLIIQQTFIIKNKCGASQIIASTFSCFNCFFQDIIALKSSVFEIKTQGDGNIQFSNLTINSLEFDLSQIADSSGCITIYSTNSLLNLKIINAVFENVLNRMATSLFTISPSFQKNYISLQDVIIKNCISLKNPIINILFSTQSINSNKVMIQNVNINFEEAAWMKYFQKTGMINQNEIIDITDTSNALIQLQNCNVVLSKILISGIFSCPLIKLINVQNLLISSLWVIEIKTFYGFNLLELNQDLLIKQTIDINSGKFQRISIYEISTNPIYYNSQLNYMIKGCFQIQNLQQQTLIYTFDQIIKLLQSTQKSSSIILFQSTSNNTNFYVQNIVFYDINCSYCSNGLIFFNIENYKALKIRELTFDSNQIKQFGCVNMATTNQISQSCLIKNSNFLKNNGSSGVAIYSASIPIKIIYCNIIKNIASNQGGGIYLNMNTKDLIINKSTIINNLAFQGGGIYLFKNANINQKNLIQTFLQFNKADFLSNNLVEYPTHLSLFINSKEMQAEELKINNITINILNLKPYKIIDQGAISLSQYLMIPSQQVIKQYKIFIPQLQIVQKIFSDVQITLRNSRNELQQNAHQITCLVSQKKTQLKQVYTFEDAKLINSLQIDEFNHFDLGSIQFHYDPYQGGNQNLQILVNCSSDISQVRLFYLINSRTYKCQLGEFLIDEGCQVCESTLGFYSVTYNTTKCSIFDKTRFANISSHSIQLLEGYWRPNMYSDYIDYCLKNIEFCKGGWKVGDELCSMGHLGGLCEECDHNNMRGDGNFFKVQQDSQCYSCSSNTLTPLTFSFIWSIISVLITLKSIQKSNLLFSKLQFKLRYRKILFKLEKDMEGIFIKMLFIYLWIFSVIFTFNIKFSISFSFIDQTSNTSQFMASSLDCFLSEASQIQLIYVRIIATILLILIQVAIILIGYQVGFKLTSFQTHQYIYMSQISLGFLNNFVQLFQKEQYQTLNTSKETQHKHLVPQIIIIGFINLLSLVQFYLDFQSHLLYFYLCLLRRKDLIKFNLEDISVICLMNIMKKITFGNTSNFPKRLAQSQQ
ncbi:unnamed protein product [Paramecium octaurelia]|uniref:Uncharacterized protein n=1 Tax=Paramecium octaurelia TaxID=43137 RepID=A0A8S1XI73_PAROT|nr:unnamed protein product [Paramecium octaurelia]